MRFAWIASLLIGASVVGSFPAHAEPPFVSGEILVKLGPGLTKSEIAAIHAANRAQVLEVIPELGVYRLSIPTDRPMNAMIEAYQRDPRCIGAQPNYIGEVGDFIPSDPYFSEQWHLHNTGQVGGTVDADIDAVEGWEFTRGDASIIVAVLDTGIHFDHNEFEGRILPGFDFVNEDDDPTFDNAHGVYVSGILAANPNNSFSVAGVDHFVRILPVKVISANGFGTTMDLSQGLVFATDQGGANVINMSLQHYPITGVLHDALQYARDSYVILVSAAGNGGIGDADLSGPGNSPLTISVGATNVSDQRADFSGTGSALDVVAPGLHVATVSHLSAGPYAAFSGTSAAAPIVSGIVSLLLSVDPLLTHDEVLEILTSTAEDLVGPPAEDTPGRDDYFGHGRVNLRRALIEVPEPSVSLLLAAGLGCLAGLCRLRARTLESDRLGEATERGK
jgi:subtilisin family serine protease